jgi:hypothetical protein
MPTKRTPLNRRARRGIRSVDMRRKCERYLELCEAHNLAIVDARPENQTFYTDGRLHELVALLPEVCQALDIYPHEDGEAIVRAALAELEGS